MSREQKIALILGCVFYVATIFGFFYFSLTLIVILFCAATISMTAFSYLCYKAHNDYTGAEHLQQEIGLLKAEIDKQNREYEAALNAKNDELEKTKLNVEELTAKAQEAEKSLAEAKDTISKHSDTARNADYTLESLLPPDDDDARDVDIIGVARRAIAELDEAARAVGLKVTISSPVEKLIVHGSAKRLLIMFRNIIDNSIKYMQKAGTLVVTISTIDDDIFIVLKDTGKGLPENETKHIFELNFQGSNRISGNGLGLTQAKAIVEHYGGTIYARSPQGNGMGIYIQLPTG